MSVKKARARLALVAACILCGLCGCGTLYLHNDTVQQATADARAALDKVDVASVFDNQAAYLADLQKREYAAVADWLGAQRDESLLQALEGVGGKDGDGRTLLGARIDGYLQSLVCTSDRGNPLRFSTTVSIAFSRVSEKKSLADALAEQLASDRGRMPACIHGPASFSSPSGISLDAAITAVQHLSKELRSKQTEAKEAKDDFDTNLDHATRSLNTGTATQQTFTDLLTRIHTDLGQVEDTANPYLTRALAKSLLDAIDPLIAVTDPATLGSDPGGSRAKAALALVGAGFGVGDAFSKPPRVPHPNALAATRAWLDYVVARADARVEQIEEQQAASEALLSSVARQVYYLSLSGHALDDRLVAKQALKSGEGLENLLTDKGVEKRRAASAALYYYAAAWSKGFIPAEQLREVSLPVADRRAKLQQSRLASEAWLGTLKPAVATLAAYGEGGIDPKIIAQFLQVLGITAVAVGVN